MKTVPVCDRIPNCILSSSLRLGITAVVLCLFPVRLLLAQTITFVQSNYATPQSAQTVVPVKYSASQTVGDLNVVVVGWNDSTATITNVVDSSGNVYARAIGPTSVSGSLSQSIYYARNIVAAAAGANTVTVTFSTAATYADVRILQYHGADPVNPVDVAITGQRQHCEQQQRLHHHYERDGLTLRRKHRSNME